METTSQSQQIVLSQEAQTELQSAIESAVRSGLSKHRGEESFFDQVYNEQRDVLRDPIQDPSDRRSRPLRADPEDVVRRKHSRKYTADRSKDIIEKGERVSHRARVRAHTLDILDRILEYDTKMKILYRHNFDYLYEMAETVAAEITESCNARWTEDDLDDVEHKQVVDKQKILWKKAVDTLDEDEQLHPTELITIRGTVPSPAATIQFFIDLANGVLKATVHSTEVRLKQRRMVGGATLQLYRVMYRIGEIPFSGYGVHADPLLAHAIATRDVIGRLFYTLRKSVSIGEIVFSLRHLAYPVCQINKEQLSWLTCQSIYWTEILNMYHELTPILIDSEGWSMPDLDTDNRVQWDVLMGRRDDQAFYFNSKLQIVEEEGSRGRIAKLKNQLMYKELWAKYQKLLYGYLE